MTASVKQLSIFELFAMSPDVLTVIHDFKEEGDFIGIVTANVDGDQKIYRAVFPFEVGYTGLGYWPFFILLLLAIQLQYFFMSGRFKRWRENRAAAAVVALLLLCAPISGALADEWVSSRGVYTVSFESSLEPIEINQIHAWILHITSDGEPVTGASLAVSGGMPAHDHGMPTRPRVTAELGNGHYRLEGMRFHMGGDWEVSIEIKANGSRHNRCGACGGVRELATGYGQVERCRRCGAAYLVDWQSGGLAARSDKRGCE